MSMILREASQLRQAVAAWKSAGMRVAIVPTMGALHEGHLALVRRATDVADKVIVSIFVNPKQFAATEDLSKYPRTEETDVELLDGQDVDIVYAPTPEQIYPEKFSTTVTVAGPAKTGLEDKFRPQFLDGVATVVAKLFIQSNADVALFGEKDFQQLAVVRQMARDLDLAIEVIGVPTVRDEDGMALSSRNRYLSKHERHQSSSIHRSLQQAAEKIRNGTNAQSATRAASRSLMTLGFKVDYVTARNADTLALPHSAKEPLRILAAAWIGTTRLIDNIKV
jgi:pantoate--beta-alanine ligase